MIAMEGIGPLIRRLRTERGWSQERLAEKLNDASGRPTNTRHDVYRWEHGKRAPRTWLPTLAEVFEVPREVFEFALAGSSADVSSVSSASPTLSGTHDPNGGSDDRATGQPGRDGVSGRVGPVGTGHVHGDFVATVGEDDEVRRRELLSLFAGTAAGALVSDLGEGTRRNLEQLLPINVSDRDLDEWERSVDAYGVEIGTAPPTVMLQHLLADINEVNGLLAGRVSLPSQRRLLRVATQLSVLIAVTVIAAGAPPG